jgi:hypothetical protein
MQKWVLYVIPCGLSFGRMATDIWSKKEKKTGRTQWDNLTGLASSGWELVDVTPGNSGGTTSEILFTYKRPVE